MNTQKNFFSLSLIIVPALFLAGCNWFSSKKDSVATSADGSTVLASVDGKTILTVSQFEQELEQIMESNPNLRQLLPMMPDLKENIFKSLVDREVMSFWVKEKGVDQQDDYKKDMARMQQQITLALNMQYFSKAHEAKPSEKDVKEFYEKNKETMPQLLISRGGVKVVAVSLTSAAAAQDFLKKVQAHNGDIKKAAQEANLAKNIRDFKMVNEQSLGIDAQLKDAALSLKKVPATDMVKVSDKLFWVFRATDKEQAQYRPFDQVKEGLTRYLEREQTMKNVEKAIDEYKAGKNVVINNDFLKAEKEKMQQEQAAMQPAAMPAAPAPAPVAPAKAA